MLIQVDSGDKGVRCLSSLIFSEKIFRVAEFKYRRHNLFFTKGRKKKNERAISKATAIFIFKNINNNK